MGGEGGGRGSRRREEEKWEERREHMKRSGEKSEELERWLRDSRERIGSIPSNHLEANNCL